MNVIKEFNTEFKKASNTLDMEVDNFEVAVQQYIEDQIIKTIFSFFKCITKIFAAAFGGEVPDIGQLINGYFEFIELVQEIAALIDEVNDLMELIDELEFNDIDDSTSDPSTDFLTALNQAVNLKLKGPKFDELKNIADNQLTIVNQQTDFGISGMDKLIMAYSRVSTMGKSLISEVSEFADTVLSLAERKDNLAVAENDLLRAIDQVRSIQESIEELEQSKNDYQNNMNNIQQDYQDAIKEMEEKYINMTQEMREEFRIAITTKFEAFKDVFKEMRAQYLASLDNIVSDVQGKIYGLRSASMNQRSMLLVLYKDYCDALFYHGFVQCDQDDIPLLGDEMSVLLDKLFNLQWDSISNINNLPSKLFIFADVSDLDLTFIF